MLDRTVGGADVARVKALEAVLGVFYSPAVRALLSCLCMPKSLRTA